MSNEWRVTGTSSYCEGYEPIEAEIYEQEINIRTSVYTHDGGVDVSVTIPMSIMIQMIEAAGYNITKA